MTTSEQASRHRNPLLRLEADNSEWLSLGATAAVQAVGVVTGVILARILGVEDRGALAGAMLMPALLPVLVSLGLPDAITVLATRTNARRLTGQSLKAVIPLAIAAALISGIFGPGLLSQNGGPTPSQIRVAASLAVPFSLVMVLGAVLSTSRLQIAYHGFRLVVPSINLVGLVGLAVVGELSVGSALAVYGISIFVALLLSLRFVSSLPEEDATSITQRRLYSFGLKCQATNVTAMANERVDQLVIAWLLPAEALGSYVVAVALAGPVALVGVGLYYAAVRDLPRLDNSDQRRAVKRMLLLAISLSLVLGMALWLSIHQVIRIVFGSEYSESAGPARILIAASVFLALFRCSTGILRALRRPATSAWLGAIAMVITVAGLSVLVPRHGLGGAAWTSLAAYFVASGLAVVYALGELRRSGST